MLLKHIEELVRGPRITAGHLFVPVAAYLDTGQAAFAFPALVGVPLW